MLLKERRYCSEKNSERLTRHHSQAHEPLTVCEGAHRQDQEALEADYRPHRSLLVHFSRR